MLELQEKGGVSNKMIGYYQTLRLVASVLVVLMPALVHASTEHLPILFVVLVPSIPFLVVLLASVQPGGLDKDKIYKKTGALLFSTMGAVAVIVAFSSYYRMSTESYSGGGANIGLGLVMMSMPFVILLVMSLCWFAGGIVGAYVGRDR